MESVYTIEKVVFGGAGLARTSEGIVFIPGALPGETVAASPDTSMGGQRYAILSRIIEPSPHRRQPICPYFGTCGGCDFLHCAYEQQLQIKKEIFIECLNRIGKIRTIPHCETFASPEHGYRRRAQFKVDSLNRACGFYKQKSHEVVAISSCPLLAAPVNTLLNTIRTLPWSIREDIDQIKVIAGDNDTIAAVPALPQTIPITTITVGNAVFTVRGDSFFQNNIYLSEVLGTWAHDKVSGNTCIDLYGGLGFFSILLGKCFSSGILVESVAAQIRLAQQNFIDNGLSHFTAKAQTVEDFLQSCRMGKRSADCCIVDPPRNGLSPAARKNLAHIKPKSILYISCNPSTQARDIGYFVSTGNYRMTHCAVFDLYPNTSHLESAVVLRNVTCDA